jgi:cellulose synthase/poly-beta-1,6-N-acetylglucosamine synthase-like glycosyltransferase
MILDGLLIGLWLACLGACVYVYIGYPCLLKLLGRLRPRPFRSAPNHPPVSVIIAAHNEAAVMDQKLRNTLDLDYAGDLEILLACDGCTDGTVELARRLDRSCIRILELPRCGKGKALNAAVAQAGGEVLVFTDANTILAPDSVTRLLAGFADPQVGGVCGNLRHLPTRAGDTAGRGEGLYWRYDKWIKRLESACDSIVAADGSLYALRRKLFVPIMDPALADDMAISMRVVLQGQRLVYEPRALAYEEAPSDSGEEFRRKIRITNHSIRALLDLGSALWTPGLYSVEIWSHKLLRHLIPFFLIGLAGTTAWLAWRNTLFALAAALQLAFYSAALSGFALRRTRLGRCKPLTVPFYFCLANLAAFLGTCSVLAGRRTVAWSPRKGLGESFQ